MELFTEIITILAITQDVNKLFNHICVVHVENIKDNVLWYYSLFIYMKLKGKQTITAIIVVNQYGKCQ